jgi:multidrug efflux pump subunit AcrA (membrane-fusion protein)
LNSENEKDLLMCIVPCLVKSAATAPVGLAIALMLTFAPASFAAEGLEPRTGITVSVAKTAKTCFADTITVTGVLIPKEEAFVRPEREGLRISQVLVNDGELVTTGQALVRLVQPEAPAGTAPITLTAPVAGKVRRVAATVGTLASMRAEPLVQIISQGEIELQADVLSKDLGKLAPGQKAKVSVVGVGPMNGQVRLRAPTIDPMTQLAQIRLSLADSQRVNVGAFARAEIIVGQSCGVAVPMSAVLYGRDGAVVQVVRDNRVETRRVKVGLSAGGDVEIREGVAEGETIIVRAGAFLRESDRVRPILLEQTTAKK